MKLVDELIKYLDEKYGADIGHRIANTVNVCNKWVLVGLFASGFIFYLYIRKRSISALANVGEGGSGGSVEVEGTHITGMGGSGGIGGVGSGGVGGNVKAKGDYLYVRGGDGGNAGQSDGRGGKRPMSPGERENLSTWLWPFGCGGIGANTPEYNRKLEILKQVRFGYFQAFPQDVIFIEAGVDHVPIRWVNKRLEEMGESWRVRMGEGGYEILPFKKVSVFKGLSWFTLSKMKRM